MTTPSNTGRHRFTLLAAWESPRESNSQQVGITRLVYAEPHDEIRDTIVREKAMKKWKRQWKLRLIRKHNPDWRDLYEDIQTANL